MLTRNSNYSAAKWPRHSLGMFTPYFASAAMHFIGEHKLHLSLWAALTSLKNIYLRFFTNDSK